MAPNREEDTLSARVGRYAQVSTRIGGFAVRAAGGRLLRRAPDRAGEAAELRRVLGNLKGPVMKVAQLLSTIPDALPGEYAAELAQLQSNAPAMGWAFVQRRMTAELGPKWRTRFGEFGRQAAAAASLGQVHKATSPSGEAIACKLQYPNMAATVEADLRQLGVAFAIHRRLDKSIDTTNMRAEIAARLREELDYGLEARHVRLYGDLLKGQPGVHVPKVLPKLSTRRLLAMTWMEGRPLVDFVGAPADQRNRIARNLFAAWYGPFYRAGIIHGDPHLGNYSVAEDLSVNLLDFGCMRTFQPKFVQGVIDLYHAMADGDASLAVHAYETWGFEGLNKEVIEALNLWAAFIYAPLLEDRTRRIQEFEVQGVYGQDIAMEVHRRLKEKGGVTPPREFVFMDRAAIGLGGVFLRLGAELNWHRLFHELIDGFAQAKMRRLQERAFTLAGVPLP